MRRLFVLLLIFLPYFEFTSAMQGDGSEEDPYRISTVDDLYEFASILNGRNASFSRNEFCAVLENDIVVNENVLDSDGNLNAGEFKSWEPLCPVYYYKGIFDGNGKTIYGLYCNYESVVENVGFFAKSDGEIKNLTISDSYFSSPISPSYKTEVFGGICALSSGLVDSCRYEGLIKAQEKVGLIVGEVEDAGVVQNSSSSGFLYASFEAGGIVGVSNGEIINCSSDANLKTVQSQVGGICGSCYSNGDDAISHCTFSGTLDPCCELRQSGGICGSASGDISNCVNKASFWGTDELGGIVGSSMANVVSCLNVGSIKGKKEVGGICGNAFGSVQKIMDSYNEGTIQGETYIGGIVGRVEHETKVIRCCNKGFLSGSVLGGIAGYDRGEGEYENCYNLGAFQALRNGYEYDPIGGICGKHDGYRYYYEDNGMYKGLIDHCYSAGQFTEGEDSVPLLGKGDIRIENSYYLMKSFSLAPASKTLGQFMSGEVAYLLQKDQEDEVWGQKIGVDSFPVLNGEKIYSSEICPGRFSNNEDDLGHVYDAYCKCVYCGFVEHLWEGCVCEKCGYRDHSCEPAGQWMEIFTVDDLYEFADRLNAGQSDLCVRLMNDIEVNVENWESGRYASFDATSYDRFMVFLNSTSSVKTWSVDNNAKFTGVFDGQNHAIKGLCLASTGFIPNAEHAQIRNLALEKCLSITGVDEACGMICGRADQCKFYNCHTSGRISAKETAAGIVGSMRDCSFEKCYNLAKVDGSLFVGGLACADCDSIAGLGNIVFEKCWNGGELTNRNYTAIGGLVTLPDCAVNRVYLSNCYNIGQIEALTKSVSQTYAAGLVGGLLEKRIFLTNCYNAGIVHTYRSSANELVANYNNQGLTNHDDGNEYAFDPSTDFSDFDNDHIFYHNCFYESECLIGEASGLGTSHGYDIGLQELLKIQFYNGEACYLLNNGVTDGSQPYYQNLEEVRLRSSSSTVDLYPNLDSSNRTVFYDGTDYYNIFETGLESEMEASKCVPMARVCEGKLFVGNVNGCVTILDMKSVVLYSKNLKCVDDSDLEEIELLQKGVYTLLYEGKAYKVVVW
ncbi:MAG: hypothetical protein MJZ33_12640 [Paludibacteraceae bacterium]|nr:hypothetical protein [Paludibacteraceae bacterium]